MYSLVLIFGYALGVAAFGHGHSDTVEAAAPEPAPEIRLVTLDGKKLHLADYKGKWVFLNFWATWCPPCLAEMPEMETFYQKFKAKNMVMLAVSVDKDDPARIRAFIKNHGYTFDVFNDPDGEALSKFGGSNIPATFIINPRGEIVSQANGPRSWTDKTIIDYFNDLLKKG
ncbi:MAG: TlpA family protein disulfide reductase [Nitrospinae bacterium]|nr:TlpA family protein disulfide reductase [Nitrospinota bacterium]